MRILIINGYDNANLEKFQHFQFFVMKYLAEQRELIDTENEFYVRNRDTIEDFLYEVESSHVKRECGQKFDQVDVIFAIGDSHTRPWNPRMNKILILLRMCLRVKKLLFASGFAMQALVFLSASNIEKSIHLVNQNGGKISEIKSLNIDKIQQSDMFLENTSGDLYVYNYETSEWLPKTNVGLHLRRAAQEFQSIGKYVVKAPVYKPRQESGAIFKNKHTETVIYIKNSYIGHWTFKDVPFRFIVSQLSQWDVHNFQFNNSQKKFVCLAESDEGPQVLEYERALACMFEITQKYQPTLLLLRNFINNGMQYIKANQYKKQDSIENFHYETVRSSSLLDQLRQFSTLHQHKKSTLELMRGRKNTGIQSQILNTQPAEQQSSSPTRSLMRKSSVIHVGFTISKDRPMRNVEFNAVNKRRIKMTLQSRNKSVADSVIEQKPLDQYQDVHLDHFDDTTPSVQNLKEIRKLLHPHLSKAYLNKDPTWIPGHLSETTKSKQRRLSQTELQYSH